MRRFPLAAAVRAFSTASGGAAAGKSRAVARGSLLLRCPDSLGIVSSVADSFLTHHSNMAATDLHVERHVKYGGAMHDIFVCRFVFEYKEKDLDHQSLEENLAGVVKKYQADATLAFENGLRVELSASPVLNKSPRRLIRNSGNLRMGVLVSNKQHCLVDLINRKQSGELEVDIPFVISNHSQDTNRDLVRTLEAMGIEYHFVQHSGRPKSEWEEEIKHIVGQCGARTDFLILARYMQILSGDFLGWYEGAIVNIHHGLLPSFKGSNPYKQAWDAGVKLIGATAHYVTEDLDEGPIIEQRVSRVSHRDTLRTLRLKSERLESAALHDAVRYVLENRVARIGGRTIVFNW